MYAPDVFRVEDRAALLALIQTYPFATVVTSGVEGLDVGHLPLLVDAERGVLRGHVARANRQLEHFMSGADALAIFHGPHTYVSPSVYAEQPSVPTWNYVVVHVRGRTRVVGEPELRTLLSDMVARFDRTGWRFEAPADYERKMLDAIAGFEIELVTIEGKRKLSQNRPPEDSDRVAAWLEQGDDADRAVAALMRALSS